jgi:hypothetical protein
LTRDTACFATGNAGIVLKRKLNLGEEIGSGSYGTVHMLTYDDEEASEMFIGKRAWKAKDLPNEEKPQDREARCVYYWQIEDHCFSKLPAHPQLPPYFGVQDEWMVFGVVGGKDPAPTLSDLMKRDRYKPQNLEHVGKALRCTTYANTLDKGTSELFARVVE